ncbi:VanZ family protein [Inmirania thermothiophila]|uniref:VanZ like protein n=1 Tax=Inmirania thermothiophila TaxID=1750597 RepID=A0A3N1XXK8_9GAMM|nr:VanZ family protein [Inmirania thermothiophila]ROR29657.1 VanZ like protein [Inmirania thermothiophila]
MNARLWPPLALMAAILALSSVPGTPDTPVVGAVAPGLQNLLHPPLYAALAWLWWRALTPRPAAAWIAAALAAAWGGLDELHQAAVPGRSASLLDAVLDAVGALAAALALRRRRGL